MPEYPKASRERGITGVAVAELVTDVAGSVHKVRILEAPDEGIGRAVAAAVRQWRFPSLKVKGQPVPLVGKLTFYFRKRGKMFVVESPSGASRVRSPSSR
ncbi:MAG TPA: energy transducer TonB [Bryobacteraceae bacterium]|nr:energy transducer TonB [Bryobacteraceae bacterium]